MGSFIFSLHRGLLVAYQSISLSRERLKFQGFESFTWIGVNQVVDNPD
jgi:hypothetical protein